MHQAIDCMFHGSEASRDLFFSVGTPYLHARRRVAYLHPPPCSMQRPAFSLTLHPARCYAAAAPQHHHQKFNFISFRPFPLISFMRRAESVDSLHAPVRGFGRFVFFLFFFFEPFPCFIHHEIIPRRRVDRLGRKGGR